MIQVSARIFPIGFLIEVDNADFNPNDFYLNGTWERYGNGRVIVGVDENQTEFNTTGKIGGSKYTEKHKHANGIIGFITASNQISGTGNDAAGVNAATHISKTYNTGETGTGDSGNLQPYATAYRWKLISYSD